MDLCVLQVLRTKDVVDSSSTQQTRTHQAHDDKAVEADLTPQT